MDHRAPFPTRLGAPWITGLPSLTRLGAPWIIGLLLLYFDACLHIIRNYFITKNRLFHMMLIIDKLFDLIICRTTIWTK